MLHAVTAFKRMRSALPSVAVAMSLSGCLSGIPQIERHASSNTADSIGGIEVLHSTSIYSLRLAVEERIDSVIAAYTKVSEEFKDHPVIQEFALRRVDGWKRAKLIELSDVDTVEEQMHKNDTLHYYEIMHPDAYEQGLVILSDRGVVRARFPRMTVGTTSFSLD